MSNKLMNVKGSLNPSNHEAVKWGVANRIETELTRHGIAEIFNGPTSWANEEWKQGQVIADSSTTTTGGRPAAMDFITRLYSFVTAPGIVELGLEGELLLTVDAVKEPVIFRLVVKDKNVFHQEATLAWDTEMIPYIEKTEES